MVIVLKSVNKVISRNLILKSTTMKPNHESIRKACLVIWSVRRMPSMQHARHMTTKQNNEEMAILTDNEKSLPFVEAIINSPMLMAEWSSVPKTQKKTLKDLSQHFDLMKLPTVSKILGETKTALNQLILSRWIKKTKTELGVEGYNQFMKDRIQSGHAFHELIESYLMSGQKVDEEVMESGLWKSITPVLKDVGKVHCLEREVFHPQLCYYGRLDCVAVFRNTLCLIDWKSSEKRKDTISKCYDDPCQVAAYAGAYNMMSESQVANAAIIKAYPDGTPADVHFLNEFALDFFWNAWLRRLAKHHVLIASPKEN